MMNKSTDFYPFTKMMLVKELLQDLSCLRGWDNTSGVEAGFIGSKSSHVVADPPVGIPLVFLPSFLQVSVAVSAWGCTRVSFLRAVAMWWSPVTACRVRCRKGVN